MRFSATPAAIAALSAQLEDALAIRSVFHAVLLDVLGLGVLLMGESGIGKSECVLDLVERGHRLVADDLVMVTRRGADVLIGRGHEMSRHFMEIRGVGLIEIPRIFGIHAVRQQKRVEVVVNLTKWDAMAEMDRTGLDDETIDILGVAIPKITVPLNPGKNITVIAEVIAIGPPLMMRAVSDLTKPYGVKTVASLNSIMVDATGMCGACMVPVTIDGKMVRKHACIDGPEIDAHIIDWDKFLPRFNQFKAQELESKKKHGFA